MDPAHYVLVAAYRARSNIVTFEYIPEDDRVVGIIAWGMSPPKETYTIDVAKDLSIELDKHIPVRPIGVVHTFPYTAGKTIERLMGRSFFEGMQAAQTLGFCVLELSLNTAERLAIAELQINSPSTTPTLQRICRQLLASNS